MKTAVIKELNFLHKIKVLLRKISLLVKNLELKQKAWVLILTKENLFPNLMILNKSSKLSQMIQLMLNAKNKFN